MSALTGRLLNPEMNLAEKVCLECQRQFTGMVSACPHDGTLLVNIVQDPLIGTTLAGHYDILEVAGTGGMGIVYKARHTLMERVVAIKMLQSTLISDSMSVKRFQQEVRAASRINHPHVITVFDFGISPQGQPYIVMDFLQGESLADMIKNDGQVSVERSIKIFSQVCDALEHAHRQGVIHRDLKPTNIVLTTYDEDPDFVKVVDFGVAKLMTAGGTENQRLTQVGEVCGSPVYMSPEQCQGFDLDPRSDVYSMGIVMYETLTGKLPILGKTMVETMSKQIDEMPKPFNQARSDLYIPERLEQVIFRALAKAPEERHQSMDELKQDLDFAIPRPGKSVVLRTAKKDPVAALKAKVRAASLQFVALVVVGVVAFGAMIWHLVTPRKPAVSTTPAVSSPLDAVTPPAATTTGSSPPVAIPGTTNSGTTTATSSGPGKQTPVQPPNGTKAKNSHVASPEDIVESTVETTPHTAQAPVKPRVKKPAKRSSAATASSTISRPAVKPSSNPFDSLKSDRSY